MHCLCVVAVLMYVYVLSLCSGSHVYRQDVEADSFLAVSFVLGCTVRRLSALSFFSAVCSICVVLSTVYR